MLYFAYGSNLNHQQMKNRCDGAKYLKPYILKDYKLCFSNKTKTTVSLRESSLTRISFSGITLNCSNKILPFY